MKQFLGNGKANLVWGVGICAALLWFAGSLEWVPSQAAHIVSYLLFIGDALVAERFIGKTGASTLQLAYVVLAWLMASWTVASEGLNTGGLIFFGLLATIVTIVYFHPAFHIRRRISLYVMLLMMVWAPVVYSSMFRAEADEAFGASAIQVFMPLALLVTVMFFTMLVRWMVQLNNGAPGSVGKR